MDTSNSEPEEVMYIGITICRNEDCGKVDTSLWEMQDGRQICTSCLMDELDISYEQVNELRGSDGESLPT